MYSWRRTFGDPNLGSDVLVTEKGSTLQPGISGVRLTRSLGSFWTGPLWNRISSPSESWQPWQCLFGSFRRLEVHTWAETESGEWDASATRRPFPSNVVNVRTRGGMMAQGYWTRERVGLVVRAEKGLQQRRTHRLVQDYWRRDSKPRGPRQERLAPARRVG